MHKVSFCFFVWNQHHLSAIKFQISQSQPMNWVWNRASPKLILQQAFGKIKWDLISKLQDEVVLVAPLKSRDIQDGLDFTSVQVCLRRGRKKKFDRKVWCMC